MAGPLALNASFYQPARPTSHARQVSDRRAAAAAPPRSALLSPLAVIIGAARGGEAEFARDAGEFEILLRRVASGQDLDSGAPAVLELRKKRVQLGLGKIVAARVRDDGESAACADPAHGVR